MQRSWEEYGWGDTTSNDYHAHISKIERMPSVLNEAPQYPNVHMVFKNKYTYGEESETRQEQPQKKTSPKPRKKVQMSEHVEIVDSGNKSEVQETKNIDAQADGFIKQKQKGFELCKWKTFRLH